MLNQEINDTKSMVNTTKILIFSITFINEFRTTIEDVSKASKHMSQGADKLVINFETIQEISESATEGTQSVSAFTEEQLATMEGVTNSATSLSKMSEQLLNLISTFKLNN